MTEELLYFNLIQVLHKKCSFIQYLELYSTQDACVPLDHCLQEYNLLYRVILKRHIILIQIYVNLCKTKKSPSYCVYNIF